MDCAPMEFESRLTARLLFREFINLSDHAGLSKRRESIRVRSKKALKSTDFSLGQILYRALRVVEKCALSALICRCRHFGMRRAFNRVGC